MATNAEVQSFIELFAPKVIESCTSHGWGVPSAIIAQAGLESAWGTSGLAKSCFNYWGMKWVSGCGTDYKEYQTKEQKSDGTYYTVSAKFRKYSDKAAGIEGYFKFIEFYKRYIPVKQAQNYIDYSNQLKACGWATSLKYAVNIQNTVKKYGLTKYDNGSYSTQTIAAQTTPTLIIGSRNDAVMHVQKYLASLGYQVGTIDGIYGQRTASCVKSYQINYNNTHSDQITVDGIWGKQCWRTVGIL